MYSRNLVWIADTSRWTVPSYRVTRAWVLTSSEKIWSVASGSFAEYAESTQINVAQRNGTHWNRLFFLKVNITMWIRKNQQLQRNSMKSSDFRTNSKYKSSYGCRTNSHCVINLFKITSISRFIDRHQVHVRTRSYMALWQAIQRVIRTRIRQSVLNCDYFQRRIVVILWLYIVWWQIFVTR